jgi:hypothetical protein
MIDKKDFHKERSKQANFIPKPGFSWFGHDGDPIQMGLHQKQKGKSGKKKKPKKK